MDEAPWTSRVVKWPLSLALRRPGRSVIGYAVQLTVAKQDVRPLRIETLSAVRLCGDPETRIPVYRRHPIRFFLLFQKRAYCWFGA